jgi:hypothetical protein
MILKISLKVAAIKNDSIKEMQQNQEEPLRDIQSKLNQMNQVKDNIKARHFFIPNLTLFN